jgi:hypothetical protein
LLILLCGIGGTLVGLTGYLIPSIRDVDRLLPDFRGLPPVGMVPRPPTFQTRKRVRRVRKVSRKMVRRRVPLPPGE